MKIQEIEKIQEMYEIHRIKDLISNGLKYKKTNCFPKHESVKNWQFEINPEEICQANLANALACLATVTGVNNNELQHIFPIVLRIMKSKGKWSK
jgi:hypothetical protein